MQSLDQRMVKGQKTREKLLLVALNIIADSGIKSLSAGKLAIKASVSKSTIFHHFSNIDDIPLEVLSYLSERIVKPLEDKHFRSLEEYFSHLGKTTFYASHENLKYNRAFFSFYIQAAYETDDKYKNILRRCQQGVIDHISDIITRTEHITLSDTELHNICKMIAVTIDGFSLHFLMDQQPQEYAMLWNGMSHMLCQYIRSRAK